VKRAGRRTDVYYKITLNLVDVQTAIIEWADEKEIRKTEKRPILGL
jgi:PBP1b-binding outer membrane lipoprotein LpoB